ncbi:pantetheine-phosphate adenylyltransferase [Anaeromicropila populeti]|uniref:Phosphopantetheine adenylyltransferase n=1 Tax=Anaeromicropila populeti TaxID=37658 RepID=A0A1I6KI99_9FIRM|nr:pantetheine-phosphate adenylyltransferase [Anaeromicropila populeti]SFR90972.1 Phosphopantetheine adenylyltransferase [Anaeromicropila populeti]
MKIGIYPGSFDPITLGHLDVIKRSSKIVDKLIIGVLNNSAKKCLFTPEERVEIIRRVTKDMDNVEVESFQGLLVDFAELKKACVLVRGLRAITDFEYELQIAQINHKANPNVDTIFFTTNVEFSYISSSLVKEFASYGSDISPFVPELVVDELEKKFNKISD